MNEKVQIIKHQLHAKRLPVTYNLLDHSIDDIEKLLARAKSTIDESVRTTLSACRQKKIGQYKYDMLTLTVATGEEIVRSFDKRIEEEKKTFFTVTASMNGHDPPSSLLSTMIVTIETRQAHMVERAEYMTKNKIHSFFDQAPATYDDLDNNSVVGAKS